jgi:membrane fusion protein, multidrug efflux system
VVPVLSGMQPQDWVVTAGTQLLREGQRVIQVDRQNRQLDLAEAAPAEQAAPEAPADDSADATPSPDADQ